MRARADLRRNAGFALIEALVAFAILSIALGTLMSGIAVSLRADRHAAARRFAVRAAQARLERLGVADPLKAGLSEGLMEGGQSWRQSVIEVRLPAAGGAGSAPTNVAAYWAEVTIVMEDGSDVSLAGLKLVPAKPQART